MNAFILLKISIISLAILSCKPKERSDIYSYLHHEVDEISCSCEIYVAYSGILKIEYLGEEYSKNLYSKHLKCFKELLFNLIENGTLLQDTQHSLDKTKSIMIFQYAVNTNSIDFKNDYGTVISDVTKGLWQIDSVTIDQSGNVYLYLDLSFKNGSSLYPY